MQHAGFYWDSVSLTHLSVPTLWLSHPHAFTHACACAHAQSPTHSCNPLPPTDMQASTCHLWPSRSADSRIIPRVLVIAHCTYLQLWVSRTVVETCVKVIFLRSVNRIQGRQRWHQRCCNHGWRQPVGGVEKHSGHQLGADRFPDPLLSGQDLPPPGSSHESHRRCWWVSSYWA